MVGIGERMKANYEHRSRHYLTRRTPVIMRLDGRCFHSLTHRMAFERPFSEELRTLMVATAQALLREAQGAKCAYLQSDEISILLTDYDTLTTEAWLGYNVQKMCSISAAIASAYFSAVLFDLKEKPHIAHFDCRVFNIPREEVANYFVWRQQDWKRNSIQMLGQAHFSQKELHGKKCPDIHEMLHAKGVNWADLKDWEKNGTFITRAQDGTWAPGPPCPRFSTERDAIESLVNADAE